MWVGAMLDAGVDLEALREVVRSLALPGVSIRAEAVLRSSLRGTHFSVDVGGAAAPGAFVPLSAAARARTGPFRKSTFLSEQQPICSLTAFVGRAPLDTPIGTCGRNCCATSGQNHIE